MDILATLTGGKNLAYAFLVLSLASAVGLALGQIKVKGIALGIGGALFSGLAFAHWGAIPDQTVLLFAREFGLILFVYTIGLQVGPGFFESLKKEGLALNLLAVGLVALGVLTTLLLYFSLDVPLAAMIGIYTGAATNTPALAATQQVLAEVKADAAAMVLPTLGLAVAYPFGIVGNMMVPVVLRLLLKIDPQREAEAFEQMRGAYCPIESMSIVVTNPNLAGLTLRQIPTIAHIGVVMTQVLRDGTRIAADPDHVVALGDVVLAVGPRERLHELRLIVGEESEQEFEEQESADLRWERVVVTNSKVLGHPIGDLHLRRNHGVTISRLTRAGIELVPRAGLKFQFGDILTIIGRPDELKKVAVIVGNKEAALKHAQIIPIFVGIALGVVLGSIPLHIPGMPAPLKLGLAGGPIVAAIILARIGNIGPLVWFMPPSANLVMRELGIVLFLTAVGLQSGDRFVQTIVEGDGLTWMACGVVITLVPLVAIAAIARQVLKINFLTICGLLSGAQTNPPSLAYANALVPASEAPALAYATVYPLTMCLRVLSPQILVLLLWPVGG